MPVAIKFENISKQYRLGEVGTGTLSHDLHRAWAKLLGKTDPFAKVGQINDRTVKSSAVIKHSPTNPSSDNSQLPTADSSSDYVWALRDINFEVQQGEILGIIGRNGAGKSTLLKILSRVTAPTNGSIKAKGRITSLLEVGTGFHPELTGRENIYLNGAILGMRRSEITKQLEEIVEFSGCAKYIDTPVKRYSSGMTVRLGFAVAAHLESEILVVDEVLAVGDAEFQKKCIGKMQSVASGGKTILFVSHNMGAIAQFCSKCLVLRHGTVSEHSSPSICMQSYLRTGGDYFANFSPPDSAPLAFKSAKVLDTDGNATNSFSYSNTVIIEINLVSREILPGLEIGIRVSRSDGTIVFTTQRSAILRSPIPTGVVTYKVQIPGSFLTPGHYDLTFAAYQHNQRMYDCKDSALSFTIEETGSSFSMYSGQNYGVVFCECEWSETAYS